MQTFPFIANIFQTVLQQSQIIAGRFFITYRNGRDLNNDLLGQVLSELSTTVPQQKYPLAMLAPPVLAGNMTGTDGWVRYRITMCFLRPSYIDSNNNIAEINENTQTSTRPIISDWNDMANAAIMFLRMLNLIARQPANIGRFRMPGEEHTITPITTVTEDRVSGVRLDFYVAQFIGCIIEDYNNPTYLAQAISI